MTVKKYHEIVNFVALTQHLLFYMQIKEPALDYFTVRLSMCWLLYLIDSCSSQVHSVLSHMPVAGFVLGVLDLAEAINVSFSKQSLKPGSH